MPSRMRAGLLALGALVLLTGAGCRRQPLAPFDNVVVVTLDTLRADHLGCYGYPRPTSPFIDRLGREGVIFRSAISSTSHTAPSHASLFTSLHPEQHQVLVNGQVLDAGVKSLAELLAAQGCDTAGVVSVRFLAGLQRGFRSFDNRFAPSIAYRPADATVDRALEWLSKRERGRRFFLWVHLFDPHEHADGVRIPPLFLQRMRQDFDANREQRRRFLSEGHGLPDGPDLDHQGFDRYDAQIAFADAQLRRLFEGVGKDDETARRTLWVVTADHGEGLGSHGYDGHGRYLYNEQIRIPLILYGTELRHVSIARFVRQVDVMPTIAKLLGVALDRDALRIEGHSLTPLLSDERAKVPIDYAFAQRRPPDERRRGLDWGEGKLLTAQDARYKYIFHSAGPHEFYDLAQDPHELRNLIDAPHPDKDRLSRWLASKYEALIKDRRSRKAGETQDEYLEDLKALGYL